MMSDCINCGNTLLMPDGHLRCKITLQLAKELCDKFISGHPKVWDTYKDRPVIVKLRPKRHKKK